MTAYYSENDPKAAGWLRELISADVIVSGVVDERDIRDVTPADLAGFTQCHFFAGIGGWSYALRLAGWPDTREVWTGSCPCQPFSSAGQRKGSFDERHLWPAWHWLINARRPPLVFGEQVASPDGLTWLDLVQADLEGSLYQVEYADLCAAGIGAPHIRQRLFWLAQSPGQRRQGLGLHLQPGQSRFDQSEVGRGSQVSPLGNPGRAGLSQRVGDRCVQRQALESLARQTSLRPGDLVDVDLSTSGGCEWFGDQPTHLQSVSANPRTDFLAHPDLIPGGQGGAFDGGRDHRGPEEPGAGLGGGELSGQLAHADRGQCNGGSIACARDLTDGTDPGRAQSDRRATADCTSGFLGDAGSAGTGGNPGATANPLRPSPREGDCDRQHPTHGVEPAGAVVDMAHAHTGGLQGFESAESSTGGRPTNASGAGGRLADPDGGDTGSERLQRSGQHGLLAQDGGVGFWSDCLWIPCRDGKARPAQSGIFPLAARLPGSVGRVRDPSIPIDANNTPEARTMRLRGYGNSIVPQLAAEFIGAYLDTLGD